MSGEAALPSFSAITWTNAGPYRIAVVSLDRETSDFAHLIGRGVIVDGKPYRCIRVECYSHAPPWRVGASVGLVVKAP